MERMKSSLLDLWCDIVKNIFLKVADIMNLPHKDNTDAIFSEIQFLYSKRPNINIFLVSEISTLKHILTEFDCAASIRQLEKTVNAAILCSYKLCIIFCEKSVNDLEYYDIANYTWECYCRFYNYAFDFDIKLRPLGIIPGIISHNHKVIRPAPPQGCSIAWYFDNKWKMFILSVWIIPLEGEEIDSVLRIKYFNKGKVGVLKNMKLSELREDTLINWAYVNPYEP